MIKLCLIGNSQAATFKFGWEIVAGKFPGFGLTVFAAPNKRILELYADDGGLIADNVKTNWFLTHTSGGATRIDVGDYDGFLVCSAHFSAEALAGFLVKGRIDTEPKDGRQPLSSALFMRMAQARLRAAVLTQTAEKLRQLTDKPIGLLATPLRINRGEWAAGKAIRGAETPQRLAECFAAAARTTAKALDCEIFWQPEFTKAGPLHTKEAYAEGAITLRQDLHDSDNFTHMNAEYGASVWRAILANPAWLNQAEPVSVAL